MRRPLFSALFLTTFASTSIWAADDTFDGAQTLLCASSQSAQCTEAEGCSVKPPEANNVPRFIRVDLAAKQATAAWPGSSSKVSPIATVVDGPSQILLQGVDAEVPWSAAIDKASGSVVVSQSRGAVGFLVFGTCMPQ